MKPWLALLGLALLATPAGAQVEYRNLEDDRPARVEDAYPTERYAFELLGAYRLAYGRHRTEHRFVPELSYGLAKGLGVGMKLPIVLNGPVAEFRVFALFNLTTERPRLPGLALRWDGSTAAGGSAGLEALATRSLGRNRIHLNVGLGARRHADPPGDESISRWRLGIALDRTLIRSSTLLVVDLLADQRAAGEVVRFTAGFGMRRQLTPTLVLDAGVSCAVARGASAQPALTLGVAHAFAIAALMPGGSR